MCKIAQNLRVHPDSYVMEVEEERLADSGVNKRRKAFERRFGIREYLKELAA
jgi:hypothetical protein